VGQRSGEDVWREIQFKSRALMDSGEPILTLGREIPSVITGVTDTAIQRLSEDSKSDAGSEISKGTILKIWDELASTGVSEYSSPFRIAWAFVARMIDGVEYRPSPFRIVIVDEEAAMRPFTPPSDLLHLVVRWSFPKDPATVEVHRTAALVEGEVWWRQLGTQTVLSDTNISAIQTQIAAGFETFVFVCRSGEVWRTTLRQIEPGTFQPPVEKVPPGQGTSENTKLWLRLTDWQMLPSNWPERNLVLAGGASKGKAVDFKGRTNVNLVQIRQGPPADPHKIDAAEHIRRILELQPAYTVSGGPAMEERQSVVAKLARDCQHWVDEINMGRSVGVPHLEVEHGGMAGSYAVIPWVRVYSASHSPSATQGTYLVFLFAADGDRAYLSINQGTSEFKTGKWRSSKDLEAMADRHLAGGEVDQPAGNEEGADASRPTLEERDGSIVDTADTADARADQDARGALVVIGLGMPAGIVEGLGRGGHRIDDEVVDLPLFLRLHPGVGIELPVGGGTARHAAGDLAGQIIDRKVDDLHAATLSLEQMTPTHLDAAAEGRDHSEACDNNASHGTLQRSPAQCGDFDNDNLEWPLGGVLLEELDRIPDGEDGLRRVVGDFDAEFFLEGHDQLDRVERVRPEIVDEARIVLHLLGVDAEVLDHDLLNPITDIAHVLTTSNCLT